jgi:hypothetical protein
MLSTGRLAASLLSVVPVRVLSSLADRACALVSAQFERVAHARGDRTIFDHLVKAAPPGQLVGESGSPPEGERLGRDRFEHTYLNS